MKKLKIKNSNKMQNFFCFKAYLRSLSNKKDNQKYNNSRSHSISVKKHDKAGLFIYLLLIIFLTEKAACTQTDYFGTFTVDYEKVTK